MNDLLKEVEEAGSGVQRKSIGRMLFVDDFVGVSASRDKLQNLIDVVCSYCNRWRLEVFARNKIYRRGIDVKSINFH